MPPTGDSPGDFLLIHGRLLNRVGTVTAGRIAVRVEQGLMSDVTVEATLRVWDRGNVRLAGTVFEDTDNALPIAGGTGIFETVTGEARFFNEPDGSTILVLHHFS